MPKTKKPAQPSDTIGARIAAARKKPISERRRDALMQLIAISGEAAYKLNLLSDLLAKSGLPQLDLAEVSARLQAASDECWRLKSR